MGERETSLPRAILPPFLTVHLLFEVDRQVHPIHDSSAAKRSNPYKSSRRQAHQVSQSPAVFQPPGNPGRHPHASIKSHEDFRRLLNNAPPLVDPFYRGFVFHSGATRNHARGSHVSVTLLRQPTPLPHNMHALLSFLAVANHCDRIDFGGSMFHSGSPTCARVSRFDRRELPSRHGLN